MERAQLHSRSLAWALYHPRRRWLNIAFRTGKLYRYFNVPICYYQQLLAAESKGRYFNSTIRNRFPYQDLSRLPAPLVRTAAKN